MCQFLVRYSFFNANEFRTVTDREKTSTKCSEFNLEEKAKRVIEQLFVRCGLGADDDVRMRGVVG